MSLNDWVMQQEWQRDYERAEVTKFHGCKRSVYDYVKDWKHILGCEVKYEGALYYIMSIDSINGDIPVVNIRNKEDTIGFRIFADRLMFINEAELLVTLKTYVNSYWDINDRSNTLFD